MTTILVIVADMILPYVILVVSLDIGPFVLFYIVSAIYMCTQLVQAVVLLYSIIPILHIVKHKKKKCILCEAVDKWKLLNTVHS